MTILLYGFSRFGHNTTNISQQVVNSFPNSPKLIKHVFPTRFNANQFLAIAEQYQPNLIIGLGQYPRGNRIRVERVAYNSYHSKSAPTPRIIISSAPSELPLSYLPPLIPTSYYSDDPGRYVCNYSMYLFAHWALSHNSRSCFLHLPKHILTEIVISYLQGLVDEVRT